MKHWILINTILLCQVILFAQNNDAKIAIQNLVEELAESETSEVIIEEITTILTEWASDKPNINNADLQKLVSFRLINPMQAAEINHYIETNGTILTPFEILYLPSFNESTIERLTTFFSFGSTQSESLSVRQFLRGKNEILAQYNTMFEEQKGYTENNYEGKQGKKYIRYRYRSGQRFSAGITAKNDPGEAFFSQSNKTGFDFYSPHVFLKFNKIIESLALGDYQVTMGQGLICGQSIWGSKGVATTQTRNARQGFKPYTGATEYGFMRGAACSGAYKNLSAMMFASYNLIDATLDTTDTPTITSLSNTGYHRTESEINRERVVKQYTSGGIIEYKLENFKINLNTIVVKYEFPLQKNSVLHDLYDPEGGEFANISSSYFWQAGRLNIFGEMAISDNGALANLHGANIYAASTFGISVLYRDYQKGYIAPFGNAFGENSSVTNETGTYIGFEYLPFRYTKLNAYADIFKFPWLRYNESSPTNGMEYLINIEFTPKRDIKMEFRSKYEVQSTNINESNTDQLTQQEKLQLRYNLKWNFTRHWTGQTRLAYSQYNLDKLCRNGWLFYQELFWQTINNNIGGSFRVAVFDIEDYQSRIYAYEQDVLYGFSIPAFQDTGVRYYLNLRWKILNRITLYTRLSRTEYLYKDEISSGNELIEGNHKTDIHLKLKWTF